MVVKYILRDQLQPLRAAAASLDENLVASRTKDEVVEKYKPVLDTLISILRNFFHHEKGKWKESKVISLKGI